MPITRLFRLVADPTQLDRFGSVGEQNLMTSITNEPGTLSMNATHLPADASVNYVFEIYADQAAYEVHAASPQFKAYGTMASEVLTGRSVYPCNPQLLLEKSEALRATSASAVAPRLARVPHDLVLLGGLRQRGVLCRPPRDRALQDLHRGHGRPRERQGAHAACARHAGQPGWAELAGIAEPLLGSCSLAVSSRGSSPLDNKLSKGHGASSVALVHSWSYPIQYMCAVTYNGPD